MDDLKLQKELEAYLVRLCKQEESLVCRFEEERAIIQKQAQAIRDTISILSGGHPFNESKKIKVNSSHHSTKRKNVKEDSSSKDRLSVKKEIVEQAANVKEKMVNKTTVIRDGFTEDESSVRPPVNRDG